MVDVWLIIIAIVVPVVLTAINIVILAKFIHPQDVSDWLSKVVVLAGLLFAEGAILMLPLDVGNRSGAVGCGFWNDECGGLNMAIAWQIVYCAVAVFVVVIVPYSIFYYEADRGDEKELLGRGRGTAPAKPSKINWKVCTALRYTCVTLILSLAILIVMYVFLHTAEIPVSVISVNTAYAPVVQFIGVDQQLFLETAACGTGSCTSDASTIDIQVTFVVYLAALLSFVGWFFFVLYAGVGLIAVPKDLLDAYIHRPRLLSPATVANFKKTIAESAAELHKIGENLRREIEEAEEDASGWFARRAMKSKYEGRLNKYRAMVAQLDQDLLDTEMASRSNWRNRNRFWPYIALVLFAFSIIISLLWLLQIVLYMLISPPVSRFLNKYLMFFDTFFPLVGTISIAAFALYLLFCVIKGNFKLGVRFFLGVHPMEMHATYMNSFIFNVGLVLLCCLPVVQFCTEAFADYARLTDADAIFGSQVRNLKFFKLFFQNNVFLFAILAVAFLSLIFFTLAPSEKKHIAKQRKALAKELERKRKLEQNAQERELKG